ncbi:hypothetical protein SAMN04488073_2263 [Marinobacter gudaonensis]|uniref:Uncharacterized protein n=1 Tax=Marinobacter gudaonensis TaxID=375760 RepID=A0A1I6H485_9GAMM|nr:hypothetical protein [Marinobacter gudaonensis]SFR49296.1 hypothetical protein SAMN04488073_2263 [Marinobacter gudaonensis]
MPEQCQPWKVYLIQWIAEVVVADKEFGEMGVEGPRHLIGALWAAAAARWRMALSVSGD